MAQEPSRRVSKALVRLLVLGLLFVAEFAVLEAALRWRGGSEASPEFQSLFIDDQQVGHRLRPNAQARYTTPSSARTSRSTRRACATTQDIGPKAPNERRIVVLGDSLVLSVQVPLAETFCKRLEARLNAAGGDAIAGA